MSDRLNNSLTALFWLIVVGIIALLVIGCQLHMHYHTHRCGVQGKQDTPLLDNAARMLDAAADERNQS